MEFYPVVFNSDTYDIPFRLSCGDIIRVVETISPLSSIYEHDSWKVFLKGGFVLTILANSCLLEVHHETRQKNLTKWTKYCSYTQVNLILAIFGLKSMGIVPWIVHDDRKIEIWKNHKNPFVKRIMMDWVETIRKTE